MLHTIPFHASLLGKDIGEMKATHGHVLVYGAIEVHSFGPKGCIASNRTLASEVGLTDRSVANIISQIAKAGWVKVVLSDKRSRIKIEPNLEIVVSSTNDTPISSVRDTVSSTREDTIENTKEITNTITVRKRTRKKTEVELKNDSSDVNSLILYFYSKLVPAETTGRRFSSTNRKAMDSLLSTYGIQDVRATIDKAKELLGKPYKPQVQSVLTLLAKYEQIKAEKQIIKHQATTKL